MTRHVREDDLFVLPGARGRVLQGLRLDAVHFNRRFVQNYLSLHSVDLRRQIVAHGGVPTTDITDICEQHSSMAPTPTVCEVGCHQPMDLGSHPGMNAGTASMAQCRIQI